MQDFILFALAFLLGMVAQFGIFASGVLDGPKKRK